MLAGVNRSSNNSASPAHRTLRPFSASSPGFTLIEVTFVMLIAGIMATLAVPPITATLHRWQMLQARDEFVLASAVARSTAVERGDLVVMSVSPSTGSVVLSERDGTVIERYELLTENRSIELVGPTLTVCYLPRGYAHASCGDGAGLPTSVGFTTGRDTAWASVTLGRVEKL